jgi:hypothetical protein
MYTKLRQNIICTKVPFMINVLIKVPFMIHLQNPGAICDTH